MSEQTIFPPAFPELRSDSIGSPTYTSPGMTIRDWVRRASYGRPRPTEPRPARRPGEPERLASTGGVGYPPRALGLFAGRRDDRGAKTLMEQGSEEWFRARLGKLTASRVADALARTKSGWSTSRANYAAELVAERLTGTWQEGYVSAEMQWGTEKEAEAKAAYAFRTGNEIVPGPAYVDHPSVPMSGASPDGYVGTDGLIETKCPLTATHIDTLLRGAIPGRYVQQMQWQMACTGRAWADYCSYDPRLPARMQLFIHRLYRDEQANAAMEEQVEMFLSDVANTVRALEQRYGK